MFKKIKHHFLFWLGFILSPLSWWNDAFINLPLAYGFSLPFSLMNKALFFPSFIFGYWLTNLLGFLLMHRSMGKLLGRKAMKGEMLNNIVVTLLYSLLMLILLIKGYIQPPQEAWKHLTRLF